MQYITNNIEYSNQKTIIIYDSLAFFTSEICKYYIPYEVENIIMIGAFFDKPLDNLPYALKNLIIYRPSFKNDDQEFMIKFHEKNNDNISRSKIPFGCNVKIFNNQFKPNDDNISLDVDLNIDTLKGQTIYIKTKMDDDLEIKSVICEKVTLKRMKNNKTRITF